MEKQSFEAQIVEVQPALRFIATQMTGNRADAEDLVQLALVKACEHQVRLRPDSNLKAWLRRVMQHQVIDDHRRQSARGQLLADDLLPSPEQEPPPWDQLSPEDVRAALRACPAEARCTFELYHFGRLTLAELATILQLPRATVATRLHRIRGRLRGLLLQRLANGELECRNDDGSVQ
jgi:RNA polymerase sigma-70 factor (ECF subfamily)